MGTFFKFEMMTFYLSGTLGWWCWWDKISLTSGDIYNLSQTMGVVDVFMVYLLYQLLNHPSTVCINKHMEDYGGIHFMFLVPSNVRTNIAPPPFFRKFAGAFAVSFREFPRFLNTKTWCPPYEPWGWKPYSPLCICCYSTWPLPRTSDWGGIKLCCWPPSTWRACVSCVVGQWWIDRMWWSESTFQHIFKDVVVFFRKGWVYRYTPGKF